MFGKLGILSVAVFALALLVAGPNPAQAHCDTLDGPVVEDARTALAKGKVTPVLKWVAPEDAEAIREAFDQTLEVRELGPQARELADRYFFETLVRIHRASEGAPYTGLKPAGDVPRPIALADEALEKGSVDFLTDKILEHTEKGIRQRFNQTLKAKKHAEDNVAAGRRYVKDYVTYIHYIEGIVQVVHGEKHH